MGEAPFWISIRELLQSSRSFLSHVTQGRCPGLELTNAFGVKLVADLLEERSLHSYLDLSLQQPTVHHLLSHSGDISGTLSPSSSSASSGGASSSSAKLVGIERTRAFPSVTT